MKRGRSLATALILTLSFSVCTGGLLAAPLALAAEVQGKSSELILLMSPISETETTCLTYSPAREEQHASNTQKHGGCENVESCLQKAHHSNIERSIVRSTATDSEIVVPVLTASIQRVNIRDGPILIAQAGPLFLDAGVFVRSIVKRE